MFIYISDLHLSDKQPISRVDNVFEAGMYKLEHVLRRAKELGTFVVCGGEFFHEPRVSYKVLNGVIDLLKKYKVDVYTVFGNHDLIGVNELDESCALFTLIKSGLVKKLDRLETPEFIIHSLGYTKEIPTSYYFSLDSTKKKILVVHNALTTEKARYDHILIKDFHTDANLVLCGHIHQFFAKKAGSTVFISPSCMVRRSVAEKDQEPCIVLVDDKVTVEKIPLNQKAEFCITTSEEVNTALSTAIMDSKVESSNIEEYINSSTYEKKVKDFCIDKINKVRSENAY